MDGNQVEGNQVEGNQVEETPKEGEQEEPSKGTGGTPGEEQQREMEQLQEQIKQLEALQGKKDAELEALKNENDTYKKAIEKNDRLNKIQQFLQENDLFECSYNILDKFAEEENINKTFETLKNCDAYIQSAIKKDRESYIKQGNYPPGAGRNSDPRGKSKSRTKNIFGFTENK